MNSSLSDLQITIYVELVDDGCPCLRPVLATYIGNNDYQIANQDKDEDEIWGFQPGDIVRCVKKELPLKEYPEGRVILVAEELIGDVI